MFHRLLVIFCSQLLLRCRRTRGIRRWRATVDERTHILLELVLETGRVIMILGGPAALNENGGLLDPQTNVC